MLNVPELPMAVVLTTRLLPEVPDRRDVHPDVETQFMDVVLMELQKLEVQMKRGVCMTVKEGHMDVVQTTKLLHLVPMVKAVLELVNYLVMVAV